MAACNVASTACDVINDSELAHTDADTSDAGKHHYYFCRCHAGFARATTRSVAVQNYLDGNTGDLCTSGSCAHETCTPCNAADKYMHATDQAQCHTVPLGYQKVSNTEVTCAAGYHLIGAGVTYNADGSVGNSCTACHYRWLPAVHSSNRSKGFGRRVPRKWPSPAPRQQGPR